MKILTWNCCLPPWSFTRKKRLPRIVSEIKSTDADIVCLQEVFFAFDAEFLTTELKNAGFTDFFHYKNLLILSKYQLHKKSSHVFHTQGDLLSWSVLDVLYGKGYQSAEIEYDNKNILLINAHLLSAKGCETENYCKVRTSQVEDMCVLAGNAESILMGDFNFSPTTSCYKAMLVRNFVDSSIACTHTTTNNKKIDYIFVKGFQKHGTKPVIQNSSLSDHTGLLLSI